MVQSPQTMESSIYDGKIVKDESQICETNSAPIQTETDNLQQHRNKTVTTFKMKVGGHAKLVEGKPGKVFLAQNQRRERRSISCDTTPTMSPVKTSTSKQLLQSQVINYFNQARSHGQGGGKSSTTEKRRELLSLFKNKKNFLIFLHPSLPDTLGPLLKFFPGYGPDFNRDQFDQFFSV